MSARAAGLLVLLVIGAGCVTARTEPTNSLGPTSTAVARPSGTAQPTAAGLRETPTVAEQGLVRALAEFARAPATETLGAVPFADTVRLGLSDRLMTERASSDLVRRDAWVLSASPFRGHVGPFSALEFLSRNAPTTISVGSHAHCASPPVPPPTDLARLRRVSIQPKDIDTCVLWWTVDLFVSSAGRIDAVTLDLWEPEPQSRVITFAPKPVPPAASRCLSPGRDQTG
jgi:hypothetical protein